MRFESKFDMGQTVYWLERRTCERWVKCPDCLGTRKWEAKTPAGETISIECPACKYGFEVLGKVREPSTIEFEMESMVVGKVDWDGHRNQFKYMEAPREDGSRSCSVRAERDLFASEDEAIASRPARIAQEKRRDLAFDDQLAKERTRKIKDAGNMAAHYRRDVINARAALKKSEEGLARHSK